MESEMAALALDALLRAELGRPLVVIGLTLDAHAASGAAMGAGLDAKLGEPPEGLVAELARYGELWMRWLPAGTRVTDALGRAAALDADALLIWVPGTETAEASAGMDAEVDANVSRDTDPSGGGVPPWAVPVLRALMGAADAEGLHDRAVMLLVGRGASRGLARALGYDDGFGMDAPAALVATAAAEGALTAARLRHGGSSPPCYL